MKTVKQNFRKFINDCYVEHNIGKKYSIVSNTDEEVFVIVTADDSKGWSITENDFFDIDNDAKRELLYSKVDDLIDSDGLDNGNYEHPSLAGGIYGNSY